MKNFRMVMVTLEEFGLPGLTIMRWKSGDRVGCDGIRR
jgi:hypothetical protein